MTQPVIVVYLYRQGKHKFSVKKLMGEAHLQTY